MQLLLPSFQYCPRSEVYCPPEVTLIFFVWSLTQELLQQGAWHLCSNTRLRSSLIVQVMKQVTHVPLDCGFCSSSTFATLF